MEQRRHFIETIIEMRARRRSGRRWHELYLSLSRLENAFSKRANFPEQVLRYFPVALVACVEGYFRLAIKEILDAGSPYLDRASRLLGKARFDIEVVKALHGRQISIGELIAHSIPLSQLEDVNTALSILLDKDFLAELRSVSDRWAYEIENKPRVPILADPDSIYAAVSRTFGIRHIVCHEIATDFRVEPSEIESCFAGTSMFLKAAEEMIGNTLDPNAPLTQADMNIAAADTLNIARAEVRTLNDVIRKTLDPDRARQLDRADATWLDSMVAWADFMANEFKGGSLAPTIYGQAATMLARERASLLRGWLQEWERWNKA